MFKKFSIAFLAFLALINTAYANPMLERKLTIEKKYLLDDEFTLPLASGSVNNTNAFPWPQSHSPDNLRTVVDTYATTELLSNTGFETAGTNGGTISGTKTSTRLRLTNIATIVTGTPHGLSSTNVATISGMTDTTFNATNVVVTVLDASTFTYSNTGSDVLVGSDTGGNIATAVFASYTNSTGTVGLRSRAQTVSPADLWATMSPHPRRRSWRSS